MKQLLVANLPVLGPVREVRHLHVISTLYRIRSRTLVFGGRRVQYSSHSLNSLKGGYIGDYIGVYYRAY